MRKEEIVTIQDGEREITFAVKQMSALKLERFINRAVILLSRAAGQNVKGFSLDKIKTLANSTGKGANDLIKLLGGLDYEQVEPLYNELLECCAIIPDASNPNMRQQCTPLTIEGQIDSPVTLYKLRLEALKVNFGFFLNGSNSQRGEGAQVMFPKITRTLAR